MITVPAVPGKLTQSVPPESFIPQAIRTACGIKTSHALIISMQATADVSINYFSVDCIKMFMHQNVYAPKRCLTSKLVNVIE